MGQVLESDVAERTEPPAEQGGVLHQLGGTVWVVVVKLLALGVINGLVLFAVPRMVEQGSWGMLVVAVVATIVLDVVYLPARRLLPAKYLVPGTIFLLLFQVYPVLNTFYLSFTNYGVGHILSKEQAVEQITGSGGLLDTGEQVQFDATPLSDGTTVGLLLTDPDGAQFVGTADGLVPLDEAGEVVRDGDTITQVGDLSVLPLSEAQAQQQALQELSIPVGEDAQVTLQTFGTAVQGQQRYAYDEEADAVLDRATGTEYVPEAGTFTSDDGSTINPGWRVPIGFDNYERVFTSSQIRGPFVRVFLWTFAFAFLSMLSTFVVGLLLALALNKEGMRGLKTYRSLMIFPYALPSFLTALIWAGLMNESFGALNDILNAQVPWLSDPWMAKASVLLVNLWLGFPYMFVVCLGALQSIPDDLLEAARTDGANGVQAFRQVTLPLLFVSVAPLLIGTFAFNFNNFNIVFLLTGGGPPIAGAQTPAGHTDLLISYTYRLSFEGGRGPEYAFAAAIAVLIFLIVGAVSAFSFRYTEALEDINQ